MSLDIADKGRYVFYLNFRTIGTGTNFCESEQNFDFAELVDNASKYVISVERWRIPIQTIPMFPATIAAVMETGGGGIPLNLPDLYSIGELYRQMNLVANLTFSLDASGRANFIFPWTTVDSLTLTQDLADIFDMPTVIGTGLADNVPVIGTSPMLDRFDQLFKIQIEGLSGLSAIQQEIIDTNVFRNLLTDFIVPSTFNMSQTIRVGGTAEDPDDYTLSYPVRQDLEFNQAANRRFIMFRSSTPIQNVRIEIVAIYRDGTRHRITMPKRSVLEVKLAFWRK